MTGKILRRTAMALLATSMTLSAIGAPAQAATLTPTYSGLIWEPQDPNRQFRGMPALQQAQWTDGSGTHTRLIRSFLVSPDDINIPAWNRIQYQDSTGWHEALDAAPPYNPLYTSDHLKGDLATLRNTFRAGNGETIAMDEQALKDAGGRYLYRRASTDGGVHWSSTKAYIDMTGATVAPEASGHAFQHVSRLPDGSLMMPFYAVHKVDRNGAGDIVATWSAAHLLVSGDEGHSWRRAATVFKSSTNNYTESTVVRRADGRLVMFSRFDVSQDGLVYSKLLGRITNAPVSSAAELAAATWGTAYPVQVPGAADAAVVRGVSPLLHLMDQGILMLVFGRPRNKISFSYNGGTTWTTTHSFFDNIPSGCSTGYGGHPCADLGSSGYMGVIVTSPRQATIVGDNCQAGWGCAGRYSYPNGTDDRLWFATVRLV